MVVIVGFMFANILVSISANGIEIRKNQKVADVWKHIFKHKDSITEKWNLTTLSVPLRTVWSKT